MSGVHRQLQELIQTGDRLAQRYRIGERIGAGAYGMIFAGVDEQTGRPIAVKAIPPEARERSATAIERFQREMKVIASLRHQNIIDIYDWGRTEAGMIYMVLEYVDGQTLDARVRANPMGLSMAVGATIQLLQALAVAHDAGVIHRDLKPANVMLAGGKEDYKVKVLDFGMAKVLEPLDDESIVDLTREGMAVGTPRYIAPEQARGLAVGPWTDLYAVGLLFYEMLTGQQAVQASTVEAAVGAHVSREPLELAAIEQVAPAARPILFKLIEKDPERRYRQAREVVDALERLGRQKAGGLGDGDVGEIGPALGDMTGDFPGAGGMGYSRGGRESAGPEGGKRQPPATEAKAAEKSPATSEEEPELELDYQGYTASQAGGINEIELDDADGEALDLDYERYSDFAPKKNDPRRRRRQAWRDRWFRPPRRLDEWFEAGLSVLLVALAAVTLGAQFADLSYGLRVMVSSAPLWLALLLAASRRGGEWERSFGRLGWLCSVVAIGVALAMGPEDVAMELLRSPGWITRPLEGLPAMGLVEAGVVWISRHWAALIQLIF